MSKFRYENRISNVLFNTFATNIRTLLHKMIKKAIMYTKRQNKVSRLLQKELADIFRKEYHGRAIITITIVRISPDLLYAKVYLSIFAVKDSTKGISASVEKEIVLKKIQERTREIRSKLAARIKNQVRGIPNLEFFIDDSLDYEEHIEKLIY
ncbi:MAG: 30S ribosome-binding factor RbfA [Bacteroidota bacterium]